MPKRSEKDKIREKRRGKNVKKTRKNQKRQDTRALTIQSMFSFLLRLTV